MGRGKDLGWAMSFCSCKNASPMASWRSMGLKDKTFDLISEGSPDVKQCFSIDGDILVVQSVSFSKSKRESRTEEVICNLASKLSGDSRDFTLKRVTKAFVK